MLLSLLLCGASAALALPSSSYTITVGSKGAFGTPDDTPSVSYIDKDGTYYYQSAHSLYGAKDTRIWGFWSGDDIDSVKKSPLSTYVNPSNSLDSNGNTTWRCNNSPTGKISTSSTNQYFAEPNYCDLSGVWVDPDTGDWYGLVHNEFTPAPFGDGLHYDGIDYAVSTDQGHTWTIKDRVITSPYSTKRNDKTAFPHQTYYYGDGDQRLTVDAASGYFYAFYSSRMVSVGGAGGATYMYAHVARAPIKDKMAAGSWKKYYLGAWSENGVGGKESTIVPVDQQATGYLPTDKEYNPANTGNSDQQVKAGTAQPASPLAVMDVSWNAHLGVWIGEPETRIDNKDMPQKYFATDDLTTQKWTFIGDTGAYKTQSWYRWLIDSVSKTQSQIVGKNVRAYCSIACSNNAGGEYINLAFDSNTPYSPIDTSKTYKITSSQGALSYTFKFVPTGDGAFTILRPQDGQSLWTGGDSPKFRAWGTSLAGTKISGSPTTAQQWWIIPERDPSNNALTGHYRLINRYSGLALALTSNKQELVPVRFWDDHSGSSVGGGRTAAQQSLSLTAQ